MEILAPCGDYESFLAAINNGADAVYLGLSGFNARAKAENFTPSNIVEVINKAHRFGVKVYLTVNTLLYNDEIDMFVHHIKIATEAGVDAFIVQDMAAYYIIKHIVDNAIIHASTQMGVCNVEGAKILEQLGFTRVVLARETTLDDIKKIKNETKLEIEFFVQGALCVSYSGNCYYSSLLKNKSGNRGQCLQLCRTKFNSNNKDGYLLSAKDICLIDELSELANAGVCSLKIEGRLRRDGYVALAVNTYRNAIDKISDNDRQKNLKIAFCRGEFNTNAYLCKQHRQNIIASENASHSGIEIGRVVNCTKFKNIYKIEIQTKDKINTNDGLKFFGNNNSEISMGVGNTQILQNGNVCVFSKIYANVGDKVNKILDFQLEKSLLEKRCKIGASFIFSAQPFKHAQLTMEVNKNKVCVKSEIVCEKAIKTATSCEQIIKQLSKTSDTDYFIENVECRCGDVFIAVSQLNQLRRDAVLQMDNLLSKNTTNMKFNNTTINASFSNKFSCDKNIYIVNDIKQLPQYVQNSVVAFAPTKYNFNTSQLINDFKKGVNTNSFALVLPTIIRGDDTEIISNIVSKLNNNDLIIVNNLSHIFFAQGRKFIVGPLCNVTNNISASAYYSLGASGIVSSVEQNEPSCSHIFSGRFPLMTLCHCPNQVCNENSNCGNCAYHEGLIYTNDEKEQFEIRRIQISNCYFELLKKINKQNVGQKLYYDLR